MLADTRDIVDIVSRGLDLVTRLRNALDSGVTEAVMRLAAMSAYRNRTILDARPAGRVTDERELFAFTEALELDAFVAVLLKWKVPLSKDTPGLFQSQAGFKRAKTQNERNQRILWLMLSITVRTQAMRALADIPESASG